MTKENTPDPANEVTDPASVEKTPSDLSPKSDIERLKDSKEKHKAAAIAAQAEVERLKAELKAKEDAELQAQGKLQELADSRKAQLEAELAEKAKLQSEYESQKKELERISQEREAALLVALNAIPEEKRPPLDATMPIAQREKLVAYAASLLQQTAKHGGLPPASPANNSVRLAELQAKPNKTKDERFELLALSAK